MTVSGEIRITDQDRSHKFELLLDGSPVSWIHVNDFEVKVGGGYLKMGGLGGVGTLEEHRMKGYSRQVIERSISYMTENGYDISMLYGIPDYYSRWGFASTLPDYKITMPLRNARRTKEGLRPRPMAKEDAGAVIDLYELTNRHRTGPVKRYRGEWFRFRKGSDWRIQADGTVFEDDSGDIVAYYASDRWPRVMRITEVGAKEALFYEYMLSHACRVAEEKQASELEIFVPFDHQFASLCKRLGCTAKVEYNYDAMGMGRVINVRSTLEKLCPELQNRLAGSRGSGHLSRIGIRTDIGAATLEISETGLSLSDASSENVVEMPQWTLMQLILGCRTVTDVLADPAVRTEGRVGQFLETLFPSGHPYIWMSDWF